MNTPEERSKLVADAFHEDWASGPASALAQRAAAYARRRRRMRRTVATLGATGAIAAAVLITFIQSSRTRVAPPVSATPRPAYEIISDEQLLSELRDRPLLVLPQKNGAREIVLLEREANG